MRRRLRRFGLQVDLLDPSDVASLVPLARTDDLVGGVHLPGDGVTNPVDTTRALAAGARARGVVFLEDTLVTGLLTDADRMTGVSYQRRGEFGQIRADTVVNAAGIWAHDLAARAGAVVPLHAAEHFYLVTEAVADLTPDVPVLRDPDGCSYFKEEAGKLLVGWFEPRAKPWAMPGPDRVSGIPADFSFDSLPPDLDHIAPLMAAAAHRMPLLHETGIQLFFNGPEAFTPDDRYLLGESPDLAGVCSLPAVSTPSASSPPGVPAGYSPTGSSTVSRRWISGTSTSDGWMPFQQNTHYLRDRTVESLGLLYAMHWPYREPRTARGVRRTPLHDRLADRGAAFGEVAGWERAAWFDPSGRPPPPRQTYGRQDWMEHSAAEHRAVRGGVGLVDRSSMAAFVLEGPDALTVLNLLCLLDVDVPPDRVVVTPWLNPAGTVEAEVCVVRRGESSFLIVTGPQSQVRDLAWLRRHLPVESRCAAVDVTSGFAVLSLFGPRSRDLLTGLTVDPVDSDALPLGTSRTIDLGYGRVRAVRTAVVGELGYDLYLPAEFATGVFDRLLEAGAEYDLRLVGQVAVESLRIEAGTPVWGRELTSDIGPEDFGRLLADEIKTAAFLGREALLARVAGGQHRQLVHLACQQDQALLYGGEPVYRDDVLVGHVTSGAVGHTVGASVGMGYLLPDADLLTTRAAAADDYQIEVACTRVPAVVSLDPPHDPTGARARH